MASLLLGGPPMASQSFATFSSLSFSRSQTLIRSTSLLSASVSTSLSSSTPPLIYCGRGDKKTAKGKRFRHSFGNSRPKNKKKGRGPPKVYTPPLPPRKDKYDDGDEEPLEIDESLF